MGIGARPPSRGRGGDPGRSGQWGLRGQGQERRGDRCICPSVAERFLLTSLFVSDEPGKHPGDGGEVPKEAGTGQCRCPFSFRIQVTSAEDSEPRRSWAQSGVPERSPGTAEWPLDDAEPPAPYQLKPALSPLVNFNLIALQAVP